LNQLARNLGKDFDKDGALAQSGKINQQLLNDLNNQNFYKKSPPKSLANEWLQQYLGPEYKVWTIKIDPNMTITYGAGPRCLTAVLKRDC